MDHKPARDTFYCYQKDFNLGGISDLIANIGTNNYYFGEHPIAVFSLNDVGERDHTEEKGWEGKSTVGWMILASLETGLLSMPSVTIRNLSTCIICCFFV
jgi:hypothetical protein